MYQENGILWIMSQCKHSSLTYGHLVINWKVPVKGSDNYSKMILELNSFTIRAFFQTLNQNLPFFSSSWSVFCYLVPSCMWQSCFAMWNEVGICPTPRNCLPVIIQAINLWQCSHQSSKCKFHFELRALLVATDFIFMKYRLHWQCFPCKLKCVAILTEKLEKEATALKIPSNHLKWLTEILRHLSWTHCYVCICDFRTQWLSEYTSFHFQHHCCYAYGISQII